MWNIIFIGCQKSIDFYWIMSTITVFLKQLRWFVMSQITTTIFLELVCMKSGLKYLRKYEKSWMYVVLVIKIRTYTFFWSYFCPTMQYKFWPVGFDWTEHMSFLTGQDQTPKFAGQVLPDGTKSRLILLAYCWSFNQLKNSSHNACITVLR